MAVLHLPFVVATTSTSEIRCSGTYVQGLSLVFPPEVSAVLEQLCCESSISHASVFYLIFFLIGWFPTLCGSLDILTMFVAQPSG